MVERDASGRFPPGTCGNPGGRPREVAEVKELAREYTAESIEVLAEIMRDEEQKGSTRLAAAVALLDRAWGRPPQSVISEGAEGSGVVVLSAVPISADEWKEKYGKGN